jgi:Phosphotransferase enzyme family
LSPNFGEDHFPLPIAIEEITPQWLTAALRTRAPGATVTGVEVIDTINTTSTKIRLRLRLDETAHAAGIPEVVILKGGFEPHSRSLGYMHEREVRGYRDVLPFVWLPSPACYFADFDAARQQGIVIMEDLVARGVTFCHASQPQGFEQVARRLSVLAEFHARTWQSPELEPGGRWDDLVDFMATTEVFFELNMRPETWTRFAASPRGAAASVRFLDRQWMYEAYRKLMRYTRTLPHCLLHGDVHLGNLYIDRDGTPGFFDTLASHGPGILEVSYHVSASIDVADRRAWEGALVQHYLGELVRHGAPAPGFDEAMRHYAICLVYGFFIWMTTEPNMQTEAVNTANSARVSAAMLDHDTTGLLERLP